MEGRLKITTDFRELEKFQRQSPKNFKKAAKIGAVAFLNWANLGSKNESRKPPIKWGVLRASSSAFVGNELVLIFPGKILSGSEGGRFNTNKSVIPTPALSYNGKELVITWVWNTDYAAKMHEWSGGWGKATERDQDAGNKWLEKHLQKDKNDLIEVIGKEFKKVSGL